uniref:Conotoxin Mr12.8 n=1 Tax=Conus marmoreus TaxID=42752 RepID=C8BLS3_CONMR|nr:conotoxin Mr12.8 [Conus marmoreus]
MFGHTSVSFLLLSIVALGMVATVICSCDSEFSSEFCEQPEERICSCSTHVCCHLSSSKGDQCMTWNRCLSAQTGNRRSTHMQKRFLRMPRDLAD